MVTAAAPPPPPRSGARNRRPAPGGPARPPWPAQACMRCTSLARAAGLAHRRRQPALHRVGRRARRIGRGGGAHVIGRDRAAETAGKGAGRHRRLGVEIGQRIGPGGRDPGLRAAQQRRADLHRAGAQGQRRRDGAPVADAAGRDDRHREHVRQPRHQREQADHSAARPCRRRTRRDGRRPRNPARRPHRRRPARRARASATVVAQANQAMPRDFSSATMFSGNSPMIDETTCGAAASIACALRVEVERARVARLRRHRRPPTRQELAHPRSRARGRAAAAGRGPTD